MATRTQIMIERFPHVVFYYPNWNYLHPPEGWIQETNRAHAEEVSAIQDSYWKGFLLQRKDEDQAWMETIRVLAVNWQFSCWKRVAVLYVGAMVREPLSCHWKIMGTPLEIHIWQYSLARKRFSNQGYIIFLLQLPSTPKGPNQSCCGVLRAPFQSQDLYKAWIFPNNSHNIENHMEVRIYMMFGYHLVTPNHLYDKSF